MSANRRVVVMGVAGSGKTTVGQAVADAIGAVFVDADSLHPPANVAKMAAGHPLTDDDRWPWLARVRQELRGADRHRHRLLGAEAPVPRSAPPRR